MGGGGGEYAFFRNKSITFKEEKEIKIINMFWRVMPNKKGKSNEKNVRKASRYNFKNGRLYADNL